MIAMMLRGVGPITETSAPLKLSNVEQPRPSDGEVLIRVSVCGVCHTELDEIEGRLPASLPVIPGHQVVGRIIEVGAGVSDNRVGSRVGVGWIHSSDGNVFENLSPEFRATGKDANGGYAEFMTVPTDYAYDLPDALSDTQTAPLLCAGAIGYRSLGLTNLTDGDPLGLTGFGGSGHLVLLLARHLFPHSKVSVFARSPATQHFATELGADWAGHTHDTPPEQLQAIIDTTPAWTPIIAALSHLRPGGRLVINAIRKEDADRDALAELSYQEHLWMEREIKSVANITGVDIRDFLEIAAAIPLSPTVQVYPLAQANEALRDLKFKDVHGAKVLQVNVAHT